MAAIENIEIVLQQYKEDQEIVANIILEDLKQNSKNYGELKQNLEMLEKQTFYSIGGTSIYGNLFQTTKKILEEKINGLPLTNRLKK